MTMITSNSILKYLMTKLSLKNHIKYRNDLKKYIEQCGDNKQFRYERRNRFQILGEWNEQAGDVGGDYFFQDLYVAQQVSRAGIKHIYYIGSRIDGYIAHLLSMDIEVTMLDVRPLKTKVDGLHFIQADATTLSSIADDSLNAISSLHAIEHFGLGRYGDPVDYLGWKKALLAMVRKVKKGGQIFLSVPVGDEEKLVFNAHRVFSPLSILQQVEKDVILSCFALIHEGKIIEYHFDKAESAYEKLEKVVLPQLGNDDCGIFIMEKC